MERAGTDEPREVFCVCVRGERGGRRMRYVALMQRLVPRNVGGGVGCEMVSK